MYTEPTYVVTYTINISNNILLISYYSDYVGKFSRRFTAALEESRDIITICHRTFVI